MEAFRAVNFAVFPHRGVLGSEESRKSMEEMVRRAVGMSCPTLESDSNSLP